MLVAKDDRPVNRRVDEHGDRQRLRAPDAITDRAKDESARGPACDENGHGPAAVVGLLRSGRAWRERLHRIVPRENEELLVQAVEAPGRRSNEEDKPMVAVELLPPGKRESRVRSWFGSCARSVKSYQRADKAEFTWQAQGILRPLQAMAGICANFKPLYPCAPIDSRIADETLNT